MKTLGLDISTVSTGWAVLSDTPSTPNVPELIDHGYIDFKYSDMFSERLIVFRELIRGVVNLHPDINYVVVEDTFISVNPKTTKQLNRFAGVAMEAVRASSNKLIIVCTNAVSIRAAIRPGIKTDKEMMYTYLVERFKLGKVRNDETDAIAAALLPFNRAIEKKWIQ